MPTVLSLLTVAACGDQADRPDAALPVAGRPIGGQSAVAPSDATTTVSSTVPAITPSPTAVAGNPATAGMSLAEKCAAYATIALGNGDFRAAALGLTLFDSVEQRVAACERLATTDPALLNEYAAAYDAFVITAGP